MQRARDDWNSSQANFVIKSWSISILSAIRLLLFYDLASWINNGSPDNSSSSSSSSRVKTYPLRWCANVIYNSRAGLRVRCRGSFLMRCKLKKKQDNSTGPTLWLALLSARAAFQLKESKKTRQKTTASSTWETYLRSTLISFSSESSLPLSAVLSMILTAKSCPASVFDSASRTCEKAPLLYPTCKETKKKS